VLFQMLCFRVIRSFCCRIDTPRLFFFLLLRIFAAMKKESSVTMKTGELTGRVTRARAAAHCSSGQLPPLKERAQQNQKPLSRVNAKRAASDNTCVPRKRRTVLQDVTNVCCENAYKSCCNSNKIQVFFMTKRQSLVVHCLLSFLKFVAGLM